MANICTNIISITFFGSEEEQLEVSINVNEEISNRCSKEFLCDDEIVNEYTIESNWTAALDFFKYLSEKYQIDIIGVAYEFGDGYVESFEFLHKIDEELPSNLIKTEIDDNIKEGINTIVLPENELNILESDLDDMIFTDKEVFEYKEKELEDWQKRVIEEHKELCLKIDKLDKFINYNIDLDTSLLNIQMDSMINYRNILSERISKFK